MAISKSKKRYNVTLDPEIVANFQSLSTLFGFPPSFMSLACQAGIEQFAKALQLSKDKGTFTQADLFMLIAQQTKEIEAAEKVHNSKKTITKIP